MFPLKIKATIKQKFLEFGRPKEEEQEQEQEQEGLIKFSETPFEKPGHEWDALLSNWIRGNGSPVIPNSPTLEEEVAHRLISRVEQLHNLCFLDSKFPLFGFMREVAKDQKKHAKLYLWQGEADAIAYSRNRDKYVIVDFKVVDNLLDYWRKKTDLCGKHLHQCLVYAKLLKLHMGLGYLPPSLIVAIDRFTGMGAYFPLFEDYPKECYKKLDEYEWFTKQPPKRPLMIYNPEKLLNPCYIKFSPILQNTRLQELFRSNATVKDLLDLLGYDDIEIVPRKEQHE